MSIILKFSVPDIMCSACPNTIENVLKNQPIILESSTCFLSQIVRIKISDDNEVAAVQKILETSLDDIGFTCTLISVERYSDNIQDLKSLEEIEENDDDDDDNGDFAKNLKNEAIIAPEQENTFVSSVKSWLDKHSIKLHTLSGVFGLLAGIALMVVMSITNIPYFGMCIIVAVSSFFTLLLGLKSNISTIINTLDLKAPNMDTLFSVSTLTTIGMSTAHLFAHWPCMSAEGLLILGVGHIGKAIQQSMKKYIGSGLKFNEFGAEKVMKRYNRDNDDWREQYSHHLKPGNIIRIKGGDIVPVDGICMSEKSFVNTRVNKGKNSPTEVSKNSEITSGMIVSKDVDYLEMKVLRKKSDSFLSELQRNYESADSKVTTARETSNQIIQKYIWIALAAVVITGLAIGLATFNPILGLQTAISLIGYACPCFLGILGPVTEKMGVDKGRKHGIQYKTHKDIERAANIDTVAFDVNGTLTQGTPKVLDFHAYNDTKESELLSLLASIEKNSNHPIAKAIYNYAMDEDINREIFETSSSAIGQGGITTIIDGQKYFLGNRNFLKSARDNDGNEIKIELPTITKWHPDAQKIIYLARHDKVIGHLEINDPLRPCVKFVMDELQRMGKKVIWITGDDHENIEIHRRQAGIPIENVHCNIDGYLTEEQRLKRPGVKTKADIVEELMSRGKQICFVGDSENDVLPISKSHFSIAIMSKSGSSYTQDAAKAIIDKDALDLHSLLPVLGAFSIAEQTITNIKASMYSLLASNAVFFITSAVLMGLGFALHPAIGFAMMIVPVVVFFAAQEIIKRREPDYVAKYQEAVKQEELNQTTYKNLNNAGFKLEQKKEDQPSPSFLASSENKTVEKPEEPSFISTISNCFRSAF